MAYQANPFNIPRKQFKAPTDPGAGHAAQTLQSIVQSIHMGGQAPSIGSGVAKGLDRAMRAYDSAAQRSTKAWQARKEANDKEWAEYKDDERRMANDLVGIFARKGVGGGDGGGGKDSKKGPLALLTSNVDNEILAAGKVDPNLAKRKITFEGGKGFSDTVPTRRFRAERRVDIANRYAGAGAALAASERIFAGESTVNPEDLDRFAPGIFTPGPNGEKPAMRAKWVRRDEEMVRDQESGELISIDLSKLPTRHEDRILVPNYYLIPEPNYGERKEGTIKRDGKDTPLYWGKDFGSYKDANDYGAAKKAAAEKWAAVEQERINEGGSAVTALDEDERVAYYMDIWRKNNVAPEKFNEAAPITRGQSYLNAILGRLRGKGGGGTPATPTAQADAAPLTPQANTATDQAWMQALEEDAAGGTAGNLQQAVNVARDTTLPTPDRPMGEVEQKLGRFTNTLTAADARLKGNSVVELRGKGGKWYRFPLDDLGPQFLLRLPEEVQQKIGVQTVVEGR